MIKDIVLKSVPNEDIKLRKGFTGADWWFEDETLHVRVALELEWRERMALAVHEISEAILCKYLGITHEQVDEFDLTQQENELHGLNAGDEPNAPYRLPHTFATAIERIMTGVMDVDWSSYDERLSKL